MTDYYYDLHIHSVLSPCSDVLMTPNNIMNMANLKGLNIIAITDHNSLKQLPLFYELSLSYEMLLIYGVEVSLIDGSHVLCYFKNLNDAMIFDSILENYIVKTSYDEKKYGLQILTDMEDYPNELIPYYLGTNTTLTIEKLIEILSPFDHLRFLAHVDRKMNSGFHYYGQYFMNGVELTKNVDKEFIREYLFDDAVILFNSDSHQLTDISERNARNCISLKECTVDAFFAHYQHG